jgi:ornithine carbamoyltransferase
MDVSVACPEGYRPDKQILDFAASVTDCKFELTDDPKVAAAGADIIFTDVWASMGQEGEAEKRQKAFKGYQVNDEIMALANQGCMIQHCLPAHKGEEITEELFRKHAVEIYDEAENRLHVQKAVMAVLMGGVE